MLCGQADNAAALRASTTRGYELGLNDTGIVFASDTITLCRSCRRNICAVAGGAFLGSRLVKKYSFAAYYTREFVAVSAAHIAVPSLQRESGSPFMIE